MVTNDLHAEPLCQGAVEEHCLLKEFWFQDNSCGAAVTLLVLGQTISILFDCLHVY